MPVSNHTDHPANQSADYAAGHIQSHSSNAIAKK
jgi:hypothetical protein